MTVYRTNSTQETGGQTIGILCPNESLPFVPGDVCNASSYDFPVRYRAVPGLDTASLADAGTDHLPDLMAAARELVSEGVRGILASHGYLLRYQQQLADELNVPVTTSSLLQLSLVASSLAPEQTIAILAADAPYLSAGFIRDAGIEICNPIAIYDLHDAPGVRQLAALRTPIGERAASNSETGVLDTDKVRDDLVDAAIRVLQEHPNTGALVLECNHFPPYAGAIQQATGLPVYDTLTLANLLFATTHPKRYQGYL